MPALTQDQVALLKDNHYKTLNIPQNASDAEIRAAFRKLALQHHPDRHANAGGASNTAATSTTTNERKGHEEFIKIKTAYDTLSNPQTRSAYDSMLRLAQSIHATPFPTYTTPSPSYFTARPSYVRKPSTTFPTTSAFEAQQFADRQKREQDDRERSQRSRRAAAESLRRQQEAKIRLEQEARRQAELRRSWEAARKRRSAQASVPPPFTESANPNTTPSFIPQERQREDSDTSTDGSYSDPNDHNSSTSPPIDSDLEEIQEREAEQYLERKRQRHRDFQKLMAEREANFKRQQREREVAFRREQEALQRSFDRGDPIPTMKLPATPSPPRARATRPTPVPRTASTFSGTQRPRGTARPTPMDVDPEETSNPFFGAHTIDLDQEIQREFVRMQQVHEQFRKQTEEMFGRQRENMFESVFPDFGGLGGLGGLGL